MTTGKAHLRLTSPQEDVTYYVEGAPAMGAGALVNGYARLCTAPCEVELPEGEYSFALSSGGAPPTRVKTPVRVQGMMELSATHESKDKEEERLGRLRVGRWSGQRARHGGGVQRADESLHVRALRRWLHARRQQEDDVDRDRRRPRGNRAGGRTTDGVGSRRCED